ncbi:MAG: 7TM diverse intracellular signaling domain-containing protein [Ramlibacter sp.]
MTLPRLACWLLIACALPWGASRVAAQGQVPSATMAPASAIVALRRWTPPADEDDLAPAVAALDQVAPEPAGSLRFHAAARQPVWYALDLSGTASIEPLVLELTHPSVRWADLYLTRTGREVLHLHRDRETLKPEPYGNHVRFRATFVLPASAQPRTVYLRLASTVNVRGGFNLLPQATWARRTAWQLAAMGLCFAAAAGAALFALARALALRSAAYGLYCALTLAIGLSGIVITGFGEGWVWPGLAPWRGEMAAALSCVASGLALLLARQAFALEVRAPRFSRALWWLGLACPMAGIVGVVLPLQLQQWISHACAVTAMVMGLGSFWLAWRTANRVAFWLLVGYTPVVLGVALVTLGIAGVLPFAPWLLLAMPLGGALEIPFNLYGLHLLQQRRAVVQRSLADLGRLSRLAGEPRAGMLSRLAHGPEVVAELPPVFTLMLLRFDGLAPGTPTLRELDAVCVERYLHATMSATVRPDNQVGRWTFNEIVVRHAWRRSEAGISDFVTTVFAQALRCERFDIPARSTLLRVASAQVDGKRLTVEDALARLTAALDDPARARQRRIDLDLSRP